MPEPWLRGERLDTDPAIEQILFSIQQVREDLFAIVVEDIWRAIPGIPTLGFQLTHIAGSLDRLTTYLEGRELDPIQLAFLDGERTPGASRSELMERVELALSRTVDTLRLLNPAAFSEPRYVGRKKIPTTVIGLAIHIAEHTQRHCGQAITTSKLLTTSGSPLQPPA